MDFVPELGQYTHETLRDHALTQGLSDRHLALLAGIASEIRFAADEIVFRKGESPKALYFVLEGSLSVEIAVGHATARLQRIGPGDLCGWSAVVRRRETIFQLRAMEATKALRIATADLDRLCEEEPSLRAELASLVLPVVIRRLEAAEHHVATMYGLRP